MGKGLLLTGMMVNLMWGCSLGNAASIAVPMPVKDDSLSAVSTEKDLIVAGGCFWGMEAVFLHVKGVKNAVSGYAGGTADTATYEQVSSGKTGHAEAVRIVYDTSQVTIGQLLRVYFGVAHDPTQLNYQGPDHGTQYRSAVFYNDESQKDITEAYIRQLDAEKIFNSKIVTTLEPLDTFYPAETYHQNYVAFHPDSLYVMVHDAPKLMALEDTFPDLYVK